LLLLLLPLQECYGLLAHGVRRGKHILGPVPL